MNKVLILAAFCLIGIDAKNVALVIGGYGGGNSVEIITENKVTIIHIVCFIPSQTVQHSSFSIRIYYNIFLISHHAM
jgi:hypothetical protein